LIDQKLDDFPIDPVARFHLGNGASLQHMNWLADTSERGLSQSAGIMVNYVYELEEIEKRREQYVRDRHVAASQEIRRLASRITKASK
jgi:malonyl-CoA decarboxylase